MPNSTSHPRQWPLYRKIYDSALICFREFSMTLMSNTGTTVAAHSQQDFGIRPIFAIFCCTTVYILGQAFGGLVFPPIAESFGHQTTYVSAKFAFAVCCSIIALAHKSLGPVVFGRLVSGFVSAIPAIVAAGSIENTWDEKARIVLMHAWISSAVLGLSCAPSVATYISTSALGW